MAHKFIVEQHKDNLEKAHIYFYSPIPFPKKSSDSILGLEVKGVGEHGIAYVLHRYIKVVSHMKFQELQNQ
jgi:hypothetical protein